MEPRTALLGLAVGITLTAAYAAALVAVAWRVRARHGVRSLGAVWLAGGVTFALITLARVHLQGAAITVPPDTPLAWFAMMASFGYGLAGSGLAMLSIRKRFRVSPDGRLTARIIAAGIGAFLSGMLLVLMLVAVTDLAGLVR